MCPTCLDLGWMLNPEYEGRVVVIAAVDDHEIVVPCVTCRPRALVRWLKRRDHRDVITGARAAVCAMFGVTDSYA